MTTPAAPTALLAARAPRTPGRRPAAPGWDVLALAALAALWFAAVAWRNGALPMQLWDESRNANNALEMALHGRWLTPTYAGVVDHWNTKPPLMIWAMAALLKLGVAPLLAVRAPAMASALAAAGLVWAALRIGCSDRLAGFAGALLLVSSPIYVGAHGARTADYDAPESAFILAYVLAVWAALEGGRSRWLLAAALAMALGVLTKGVAALLPLPGLALYALARPRRLAALLARPGTWTAAVVFLVPVGGYYLARERLDPGYLSIVAANELGGRFLAVTENHGGGWDYYLHVLVQGGGLGAALSAVGLLSLAGGDARRRGLVAAAALSAASLFLVLSGARSKMAWYAVPLLPLLCLLAGAGVGEALRLADSWRVRTGRPSAAWPGAALRAALALALAVAAASATVEALALPARRAAERGAAQYRYGGFLRAVRERGLARRLTVVDGGFFNDAGFAAYDPMLRFYAALSTAEGLAVAVQAGDDGLDAGALAASCDARAIRALSSDYRLTPRLQHQGCLLARVEGDSP